MAAGAEQLSEHPLGKAVVACYREYGQGSIPSVSDFHMVPGRGVSARVDGKVVFAGNREMMEEAHLKIPTSNADSYLNQGCSVIHVGIDGQIAGYLVLSDTIRSESKPMLQSLRKLGTQPVLLTGDNPKAAAAIGAQLGIANVRAGCLPEDKLRYIDECQREQRLVCMIGDGINDAPALKCAAVGIAMGGVGSDIAVDAADIALVDDEIKELPHLVALARRMMTTIKLNLTFSMALNFLAIVLAITNVLNPVSGALVHNAGSVLVILHSALLLTWKRSQ